MVKQKNGAIVRRIVGYRRFEELDLNQYGRVTGRVLITGLTWRGLRGTRIAQIAPLTEAVPPKLYAVSFLTEELVSMGHEVTLFASGELRHSRQAGGGVATCVAVRAVNP